MSHKNPAASSLAIVSDVPGTELRRLDATFDSFSQFVDRYSPWLSDSCIFVETSEAIPVGAPVSLEIRLRERAAMIKALGEIDWVRSSEDEEGPPGVAVNVNYLDPASSRLIDSIFRLYTGQRTAALGDKIEETWEHDVESLIDLAFAENMGLSETEAASESKSPPKASPPTKEVMPSAVVEHEEVEPAPAEPTPAEEFSGERYEDSEATRPAFPDPEPATSSLPPASLSQPSGVASRPTESPDLTPMLSGASSPTSSGPEAEWEANLSAAFSEAEAAEEPSSETSFGFGLVDEVVSPSATQRVAIPSPISSPAVESQPVSPAATQRFMPPASESMPSSEHVSSSDIGTSDVGTSTAASPPVEVPTAAEPSPVARVQPESVEPEPPVASNRSFLETSPQEASLSAASASSKAAAEPHLQETFVPSVAETKRSPLQLLLLLLLVGIGGALLFVFRDRLPFAKQVDEEPPRTVASTAVADTSAIGTPEGGAAEVSQDQHAIDEDPSGLEKDTAGTNPDLPPPATLQTTVAGTLPTAQDDETEATPSTLASGERGTAGVQESVPPDSDPKARTSEVEDQVRTWARAWSEQQPEDFIACYAPTYSPSGLSRQAWMEQRRVRIAAPASILVLTRDLKVEIVDSLTAIATFHQDYETDTKHLFTRKTMKLSRLPEGWRIVSERVGQ